MNSISIKQPQQNLTGPPCNAEGGYILTRNAKEMPQAWLESSREEAPHPLPLRICPQVPLRLEGQGPSTLRPPWTTFVAHSPGKLKQPREKRG